MITIKVLKIWTAENSTVIILKFGVSGFTIEEFIQKRQT